MKNTNQTAVITPQASAVAPLAPRLEESDTIILSECRGDYITDIKWQRDGKAEIMGGNREDALRYTATEAQEAIKALGRGYSAELAPRLEEEAKYTPGEWVVCDQQTAEAIPWRLIAHCGCGLSVVTQESHLVALREQGPANARLIASAPRLAREVAELRAALQDCVESLNRLPDADGAYRVTCLAQARAVLARVERGGGV